MTERPTVISAGAAVRAEATNRTAFRETTAQDRPIQLNGHRITIRRLGAIALASAAGLLVLIFVLPPVARLLGVAASVDASRVTVATVRRGTLVRDIVVDGKIVAANSPALYAPSSGTAVLLVHAGDPVKKGQPVVQMESPELAARLSQEKAALDGARLDYGRARLSGRIQLSEAQQMRETAAVDEKTARQEVNRARKAFDMGAYSELELIRAENTLEKAQAALAEAQRALEVRPELNQFEIGSRKALLERQQALVDDLERQMEALSVRSPVDGQIGQVRLQDRASVLKDALLLSVVDLTALEAEVEVPESFAHELAISVPAHLSGNGGEWNGAVSAISPEVVGGQVSVRVRFADHHPLGLRQSQRVSVRFVLDSRPNVLIVDRGSFVDQGGGTSAYAVDHGIATKRAIRVGEMSIDKVEIIDGLNEGERIVVSGAEAFQGADRVALSE